MNADPLGVWPTKDSKRFCVPDVVFLFLICLPASLSLNAAVLPDPYIVGISSSVIN